MNLLWADDDSKGLLAPLGRKLERESKFRISSATSYQEAVEILKTAWEGRGDGRGQIEGLILDTILPDDAENSGMHLWHGISLARQAAELGVRTIIFLTVVRLDAVWDEYTALQADFPQVAWDYFDKLTMLEPGFIDDIIISLKKAQN